MRRKRYLMAVDSVISAIKMGSSCEASCCGLSNQWHCWRQPQPLQDETLQGTGQKVPTHCKMLVMEEWLGFSVWNLRPCSHGWCLWHLRRVFLLCSPSKHFKGFANSLVYLTGDSLRLSASLEKSIYIFKYMPKCKPWDDLEKLGKQSNQNRIFLKKSPLASLEWVFLHISLKSPNVKCQPTYPRSQLRKAMDGFGHWWANISPGQRHCFIFQVYQN